jgi:uncharacterized membrane protein (GlpM family)
MGATAYKIVGYVVWKGGKWYLRQRMPPVRALARRGLVAGVAATVVVLAVRRAKG